VRRGDLGQLPEGTAVVGIVDGVLLSDAAVGHREILGLLRRGVTVLGGGSMGALRAAELASLGMKGVGRIYEEYASGRVEGDDEVVLMYDPFTLAALSEPLINLRLNLEEAVKTRVITESEAAAIIARLKAAFYPTRSYSLLLSIARDIVGGTALRELEEFVRTRALDFKRIDAISLLRAVNINTVKF
jgi:hypothetical protein